MARILYIEDDEPSRDVLARRLELEGIEVLVAPDGKSGVELARAESPDLILLDLNLPILDGWEAARQLKTDPATAEIPIVAITAHAMAGDRESAMEAGCDEYETKPIQFEILFPKLQAILGSKAGQPEDAESPPDAGEAEAAPRTGERIMVVDDNEMSRDFLSRRLAMEGYRTETAPDGRAALEMVNLDPPAAILLDIMMPGLSGLQVLQEIRKTHSLTNLPVILVSAKDRSEDVVEGLQLGANDYVTKPVDIVVLQARLETHLSIVRLVRERDRLTRMKDDFLRIASHDLRSPLSAIAGFAEHLLELVQEQSITPEEEHHLIGKIVTNASVMNRIILDFLDAQALEDGRLKLTRGPVSLADLVRDVVENQQPRATEKGLQISALARSARKVDADEQRLRQVIQNLVDNACKFTPPEGAVEVRTRDDDAQVVVEVIDSGPGLAEEDFPKLFQRYAKLSARPTAGEKSSGLGLSICRQLVEAHGGTIGADNSEERGARFWFSLPALPA